MENDLTPEQTPERKPIRSDQQIFDEQIAHATGRSVLIFGGLGILAAVVMSTIALINSSTTSTTTVTVSTKAAAPVAAAPAVALTGDALGKQLFVSGDPSVGAISCGSCHIMSAAGTSATVGPNLDKELTADPASAARVSIVDPNKEIAKGYMADIMPKNYGTALTKTQVDAVANYVYHSTNTKAKAAGSGGTP